MRSPALLTMAMLIWLWAPATQAQDLPDFSGRWTAALDVRSGRDALALGERFTVVQLDTLLQLETAGSKRTIVIDGLPHEHRIAPQTPAPMPGRANNMLTSTTTRATSTATWQDQALTIVTVEIVTVTQTNRAPDISETKRTTTLKWRLLPDGLHVEQTTATGSTKTIYKRGLTPC